MALSWVGAAAAAVYLNGRLQLSNDIRMIGFPPFIVSMRRHNQRRINQKRILLYHNFEDQALREHPDSVFLMFEGRSWTYSDFLVCVNRVANWLMDDLGIQSGEVVAIDGGNSPEYIMLLLALDGIGAIISYLNCNLTGKSLIHCLKVAGCRLVISDSAISSLMDPCLEEIEKLKIKNIYYTPEFFASLPNTKAIHHSRTSSIQPDDLRYLVYTSGTTGNPKATKLLANKMMGVGWAVSTHFLRLKPTDRFYTCLPLYHLSALGLGLYPCVFTGCTLVLGRRFSHKTFWPEVRESQADVVQYIGELCRYLVNAPPSPLDQEHNVKIAWGNGMRADIWEPFRTRFNIPKIFEFYAASDGKGGSFNLNTGAFSAHAIEKRGALLRLIKSKVEAIVRIDQATQELIKNGKGFAVSCVPNEPGELLTKLDVSLTDEAFAGYYGNDSATSKRIIHDVFTKGDTWLRSGDMLRIDPQGRVFFVDRLGDTFRWRGENVSTTEVADLLGTFPDVAEVNVYGVAVPNADGRCGCAALVLKDGMEEGRFDFAGLARHAIERLPRYAVPIFLRVTRQLEYTGTLKLQKVKLRNEGADPELVTKGGDKLYWLPPGGEAYVPYGEEEFRRVKAGEARL